MSCIKFLNPLLAGADAGGVWSTTSGLTITDPTGNASVDFSTAPTPNSYPFDYTFTYTVGVGSCADSVNVIITALAPPTPGTFPTMVLCTDAGATTYSMQGGATPGGTFSFVGIPSGTITQNDSIPSFTYTPVLADGSAGGTTYNVTYTVTTPTSGGVCDECTEEVTAVMTVYTASSAGTAVTGTTVCVA